MRCIHIPELVLVLTIFMICLSQFLFTPITFWTVAPVRNCLGGFFFIVSTIYLSASVGLSFRVTRNKENSRCGYYRWGRFRAMMSALLLISCVGFITPTLVLVPSAQNEMHLLLKGLGPSVRREPREISITDWMFKGLAVWGPYHSRTGSFHTTVAEYKSRIAPKNGQISCGSGSRSWNHKLKIDIHHPNPVKSTLAPVIFHIHGGAYRWGDKSLSAWSFAYYLERGYAVVSPQYSLGCYGYSIEDTLGDLEEAFHYVQNHAGKWGLDRGSIHIVGDSAGGSLALNIAYLLKSPSIRSVMNNYGLTDFNNWHPWWWIGDVCRKDGDDRQSLVAIIADGCSDEKLAAISPIQHITAQSPPTVTFIGTADSLIPFKSQAEDFHTKLTDVGVKNVLLRIPTWDHVPELGFYGMPSQMQRFALDWLLAIDRHSKS